MKNITPPPHTECDTGSIFSGIWFEFRFFLYRDCPKAKEPRMSYYLPIAGELCFFLRELVWSKLQTPSPRIWTCVTDSISYGVNLYSNCTSYIYIYIYIYIKEVCSKSIETEASFKVEVVNEWSINFPSNIPLGMKSLILVGFSLVEALLKLLFLIWWEVLPSDFFWCVQILPLKCIFS